MPQAHRRAGKSADAFRTISEVAEVLGLQQHVLRFWETRFPQIQPLKRGGRRRYYRPEDVELLKAVRDLLHRDGYTIKGVQKLLRDGKLKPARGQEGPDAPAPEPPGVAGVPGPTVLPADKALALNRILNDLTELRALLSGMRR